jgi:nucleotide-binding universal stress UspA family protein
VFFQEEGPASEAEVPSEEAFKAQIDEGLPTASALQITYAVREGTGLREVLATARDEDLDLVVVGRRLPHSQLAVGSAFMKMARKAPCTVLVVPEQSRPHFERILVPVDFSAHARLALETGIALARATGATQPQITCQHVYSCGYGYRRTGTSLAEIAEALRDKVSKKFEDFIGQLDTEGVQIESVMTLSEHRAEVIGDLAIARKMDLILIGSLGQTISAASLIGATAERILVFSALPVMVVKKKGETTRFLDALWS